MNHAPSTTPAATTQDAPPKTVRRTLTDLHVSQIPWWSEVLTVLPRPTGGRGIGGTLRNARDTIRAARQFDVFISANVRNALALGLFKRVTFSAKPTLLMTEMRLDDPRPGWRWRLKVGIQRFAFSAIDTMCVSAKREADAYATRLALPRERFRYVPWHTNVLEPRFCEATGDYLFAAGRTGRDWRTLAEAVRGLDTPVTVVCAKRDAEAVSFPGNVTVLTDIPYPRYRELLEGARAVIIPLEPHVYSSGQVVILEAMALGKPTIVTRVLGSEDYVIDGTDGLLVTPGSAPELRHAIERVAASAHFSEKLGRAALARVIESHTLDRYVRTIVEVANESGR